MSISRRQLREEIAEALYAISANELAEVCDELGMGPAGPDDHPMNSKRVYVKRRLTGLDVPALVTMARHVLTETRWEPLAALLSEADGLGGVSGELKNLIFASVGPKPRIVFRDAINNEIEVIEGADRCLVYDSPLDEDGLPWNKLVAWWAINHWDFSANPPYDERASARELYDRLARSLGRNEVENQVLRSYSSLYGTLGFHIPALLPQVYLHYDPHTAREQGGRPYLSRQRMDFLLLLPRRVRVVIEVDGIQHYSDGAGQASTARYAEMMKADRELRLGGYEVYRFGGYEFVDTTYAHVMLVQFFTSLLLKHGVPPEAPEQA